MTLSWPPQEDLSIYALKSDLTVLAQKTDLTPLALKTELTPLAAKTDLTPLATTSALSALAATVPTPASTVPPAIADTGVVGSGMQFALANHIHASKAQRVRVQCAADGTIIWTFDVPFAPGVVPIVLAVAEATFGSTDVINAQVDGTPTNTGVKIRVTRTNRSTVALIGLTILSLPATPGVTWVHAIAVAP